MRQDYSLHRIVDVLIHFRDTRGLERVATIEGNNDIAEYARKQLASISPEK